MSDADDAEFWNTALGELQDICATERRGSHAEQLAELERVLDSAAMAPTITSEQFSMDSAKPVFSLEELMVPCRYVAFVATVMVGIYPDRSYQMVHKHVDELQHIDVNGRPVGPPIIFNRGIQP